MLYRILNNLVEVPLHQDIQINTTRTRGSCAHNIRQISTRVDAYKYSFLPRTLGTCYHQSYEASQQLSRSGITYLPSVCLDSSATCEQDQLLLTVNRDILIVHAWWFSAVHPPCTGVSTLVEEFTPYREEEEEQDVNLRIPSIIILFFMSHFFLRNLSL
jgi:hypothetical protein